MKLLTLNIWNYNGQWRARRDKIARLIDAHQPDVIGLQETRHDWRYERGKGQGEQLADLTGYDLTSEVAQVYLPILRVDEGLTILSREPPHRRRCRRLRRLPHERRDENQRISLGVSIQGASGPVDIYTTHFSLSPAARLVNAVEVADWIAAESGSLPTFLLGDLNAEPEEPPIRFLTGNREVDNRSTDFLDCWAQLNPEDPGNTDPSWDPAARLDYILARNVQLNSLEIRLVGQPAEEGNPMSDHLGILLEVDL